MSIYISGIGVSKGIAIGEAIVIAREQVEASQITLPASQINTEIKRFKAALKQADQQLQRSPLPLPTLMLNPEVKDIFSFQLDDFKLENYQSHGVIKAPIAV